MAESESGQERTEEASAKRLSEARERGEVPRSRELGTMLLLMAATGVLWASADSLLGPIRDAMRADFDVTRALRLSDVELTLVLREALLATLLALAFSNHLLILLAASNFQVERII